MSDVKVFGIPGSTYTWSARVALAEKGVEHELVMSPPQSDSQKRVHPYGKVPAFSHGEHTIFETGAILRYVDEAFEGPALQPEGALARARMNQWMGVNDCYVYGPVIVGIVVPRFIYAPQGVPVDEDAVTAALPKARRAIELLNGGLAGKTWFGGDTFSLADIAIGPVIFYAGMLPEAKQLFDGLDELSAWRERWVARDTVKRVAPKLG